METQQKQLIDNHDRVRELLSQGGVQRGSGEGGDHPVWPGEGIAPIVRAMTSAGIRPAASGPDDGNGFAWITFASERAVRAFLDIVAVHEARPDSIYSRVMPRSDCRVTRPRWSIETEPEDVGHYVRYEQDGDEVAVGQARFRLCYTVKIPPCDWPTVLQRLQRHSRASRT